MLPAAPPFINIPHLVKKIKGFSVKAKSLRNTATYQKLWGGAVADPGEGPVGPGPRLFFDQNEVRRAEKQFLGDWPPSLSQGPDGRPPLI